MYILQKKIIIVKSFEECSNFVYLKKQIISLIIRNNKKKIYITM